MSDWTDEDERRWRRRQLMDKVLLAVAMAAFLAVFVGAGFALCYFTGG